MSRVGKKPIEVPADVTVTISNDNTVVVKGPKGELTRTFNKDIKIEQEGNYHYFSSSFRFKRSPYDSWYNSCVISEHGHWCI